ncbi:hypothetical protein TELCIR_26316, partial [Teladorsagia circumcincta]
VFANRVEVGTFEQRQPLDGIDHVSIRGDLVKLRLFHYGGRIFPNPYMAVAELKPGKRLDISALPTGEQFVVVLVDTDLISGPLEFTSGSFLA